MAIALNSIQLKNIYAKHLSGAIAYPTTIADLGGGTFQYSIERVWSATDKGEWKVYTSGNFPVLDDKGNPVTEQQIGMFTILIESSAIYNFVMPWDTLLKEVCPDLFFVESASPPDDSPRWRSWLHREEINGKIALTLYIRSMADNAAIPIWKDSEYADVASIVPGHSNAVAISDTEFRQNLISGVSLIYTPKRDLNGQIGIRLFTTAAAFSSIAANALDSGGAMISGWARNLTDFTGEQNLVTPPAQAVKIKLTFTRSDNSFVFYEFPIT